MGMRQPARFTTPAYGVPEAVAGEEPQRGSGAAIPLAILVLVLAAAAVWFVALPALHKAPVAKRSCEVVVLASGSTACVRDPTHGSRAVARKGTQHPKR
jgi:hypothetical protein